MEELGSTRNIARIYSPVSGETKEFYYRIPTTEELTEYSSNLFKRKGRKMQNKAIETRIRMAKKILTGFHDGDFGINKKPISSDPDSPDYYPQWLRLLEEGNPGLLSAFAFHVFEGAKADEMPEEDDDDDKDDDDQTEDDDLPPLSPNSGS